ncbi:hypothetical protein ANN_15485 [Periplaneta americana]|uniref:Uncharacterized protein n=1 Tax=Periplaneta americana TaxID=6978 RepID=A0ABQ8SGM1_PERAM|nr:hypothetical protein ANN_15485 [Periplaneta americana]
MAGLCEGGNEPEGCLKAICKQHEEGGRIGKTEHRKIKSSVTSVWRNGGSQIMTLITPCHPLGPIQPDNPLDLTVQLLDLPQPSKETTTTGTSSGFQRVRCCSMLTADHPQFGYTSSIRTQLIVGAVRRYNKMNVKLMLPVVTKGENHDNLEMGSRYAMMMIMMMMMTIMMMMINDGSGGGGGDGGGGDGDSRAAGGDNDRF